MNLAVDDSNSKLGVVVALAGFFIEDSVEDMSVQLTAWQQLARFGNS